MFGQALDLIRKVQSQKPLRDPVGHSEADLNEQARAIQSAIDSTGPFHQLCGTGFGRDIDRYLTEIVSGAAKRNGVIPFQGNNCFKVVGKNGTENFISKIGSSMFLVDSKVEGPVVLVQGGVHGNEFCGVHALISALRGFASGGISLQSGVLIFVAGNEHALRANKRSMLDNQNRAYLSEATDVGSLAKRAPRFGYENDRAHAILEWVRHANYVLDLHSTTLDTPAFGLMIEADRALGSAMGLEYMLEFDDAVGLRALNCSNGHDSNPFNGTFHGAAHRLGATSLNIECGPHSLTSTWDNAIKYLGRFLCYLGLINDEDLSSLFSRSGLALDCMEGSSKPLVVKGEGVLLKNSGGTQWTSSRRSFELVVEGELLLREGDCEFRAPESGYLVLPTPVEIQREGEEVAIFAVASDGASS